VRTTAHHSKTPHDHAGGGFGILVCAISNFSLITFFSARARRGNEEVKSFRPRPPAHKSA
jgi:hypothetical protein